MGEVNSSGDVGLDGEVCTGGEGLFDGNGEVAIGRATRPAGLSGDSSGRVNLEIKCEIHDGRAKAISV